MYRDRLQTKKRISRFLPVDPQCHLCNQEEEDSHHLFCRCSFTKETYQLISTWAQFDFQAKSIEEVTQRITNISPAKRRLKIAAIFAACVYNIWKARNEVLHKNLPTTPGAVSQRIHTHMTIFLNSKGIIME
ncbi:unnamed protein product [Cuscuta campestris]|uniref:Reverse transcriptase zinc-binding domain-containing protein n=1 Tax=Cuscuta campestris TaxID=132261 RepID=A0A484NA77_9ASTE|nr:unnamed protein product [Cuscuta campestris]